MFKLVLVTSTKNYDSLGNVDTNRNIEGELLSTYSENNYPAKEKYYATGKFENESFENEKENMVKDVPVELDYDDYDSVKEFEAIIEREDIGKNHLESDNAPRYENSMNNFAYDKTYEEYSDTHNQEMIYLEDSYGTDDLYPEEKDPNPIIEDNSFDHDNTEESRHSNDDASDDFGGLGNDENYDKNLSENDDIEEAMFIRSEYESSHMALKSSNNVENEANLSSNMLYNVSSGRIISVEPSLLLITVLVFMNTHLFISYRCQG